MKRKTKLVISVVVAIIHNVLFWNQYLGLNLLIFNLLLLCLLLVLNQDSIKNKRVWFLGFALIITSIATVINGSFIARLAAFIGAILLVAQVHAPQLRSIFYLIISSIEKLVRIPSSLSMQEEKGKNEVVNGIRLSTIFKIWVLPVVAFFVFLFIYKAANPLFDGYVNLVFEKLAYFISSILGHFSIARIFFFNFGLIIAFYMVFKPFRNFILNYELSLNEFLIRRKKVTPIGGKTPKFLMTDLRTELKIAISLMVLLNLLLGVVNVIDINWLWLNFELSSVGNLSQLVHEGTYLLILSILLSMIIVGYFYRGNLNFYSSTKLRLLSYGWIFQNIIMVISVGVRNYHYITQHGLAYKRIGVIIFLILVIVGLLSQVFKIWQIRSSFFLIQMNSLAAIIMLVFMSTINWDLLIAQHNLAHSEPRNTDLRFLLTLSNKTLPLLDAKRELFDGQMVQNSSYEKINALVKRIEDFKQDYEKRDIWSWNYADFNAYNELTQNKH